MKFILRLFAAASLLAASGFAADAFEGKVSLTMTAGKNKSQTIDYSMKQDSMRIELNAEGQAFASIMDLKKKEMIVLMPDQAMYMVMPLNQAMEKMGDEVAAKDPDIQKTGRTETILGYKCDEYITKDKNTTTELWIAEGLGAFMGLGSSGGGMGGMFGGGKQKAASGWEEKFKGKGGFPLRVVSRDAKTKETFRMEATKIEPGALPASLFMPPDGYKKFDLGGMLQGLGK